MRKAKVKAFQAEGLTSANVLWLKELACWGTKRRILVQDEIRAIGRDQPTAKDLDIRICDRKPSDDTKQGSAMILLMFSIILANVWRRNWTGRNRDTP